MALIDKIKAKAKANVKHIVLPEGEESRNVPVSYTHLDVYKRQGSTRRTARPRPM